MHRDDLWELDGDVEEALGYAEDAVDSATQSAQILGLLLSEKTIFRRKAPPSTLRKLAH